MESQKKKQNEDKETTLLTVRTFFKEQLKIKQEILIVDAHRLIKVNKNEASRMTRSMSFEPPLIIRLSNLFDKDLILHSLKNLKPTDTSTKQRISVNQHLPAAMFKQKKKLYGKFKKAREDNLRPRWIVDYKTADYCLNVDGTKFYAEED